jgi:hypothetical protein
LGIDIYLRWRDMTPAELEAQRTGFSVEHGHVGYLREAYHEPYATQVLVPEAFAVQEQGLETARLAGLDVNDGFEVAIPGHVLRGRLEAACGTAIERGRLVYDDVLAPDSPAVRSFIDFVSLVERLEREGREPRVYASY